MCAEIKSKGKVFSQDDLELYLSSIYSAENLAAMVTERYIRTPFIQDYKLIISESINSHFMGFDHVAVAGLMPVIEGAATRIAKSRNVPFTQIRPGFAALAEDCKRQSIEKGLGAVGEIVSMMDSFADFTQENLYIRSEKYPHTDKTNRHGILHGSFSDEDYGKPINFYKAIAAIDFLCLISAFNANISWLAPNRTTDSESLAAFYLSCKGLASLNPLDTLFNPVIRNTDCDLETCK